MGRGLGSPLQVCTARLRAPAPASGQAPAEVTQTPELALESLVRDASLPPGAAAEVGKSGKWAAGKWQQLDSTFPLDLPSSKPVLAQSRCGKA